MCNSCRNKICNYVRDHEEAHGFKEILLLSVQFHSVMLSVCRVCVLQFGERQRTMGCFIQRCLTILSDKRSSPLVAWYWPHRFPSSSRWTALHLSLGPETDPGPHMPCQSLCPPVFCPERLRCLPEPSQVSHPLAQPQSFCVFGMLRTWRFWRQPQTKKQVFSLIFLMRLIK